MNHERAGEPVRLCWRRLWRQEWIAGARGGAAVSCPAEALELQEVEGVDVPQHDGFGLGDTAHQELLEAVVAHMGVRPFAGEAAFVDGLALCAGHSLAPGDDAWPIILSRYSRVALAVVGQGAEDLDLLVVQLLDVGFAVEAAVSQRLLRQHVVALFDVIDRRSQQAAIGSVVGHRDADDVGALDCRRELRIVGWPIAAIAHLHDPSLRVARRGPRRLVVPRLLAPLLAGFLRPPFLDLGMGATRLFQPPKAVFPCCLPPRLGPPFSRAGVFLDLSPQLLDRFLGCRIKLLQPLARAERTATACTSTRPEAIKPVIERDSRSSSTGPASLRKSDSVW